ncbi:hypothetical protein BX600DRAFT_208473 [Xylariales sp. PMI_506]|nr:hypothetical protein BX600DRAFT_208473 [Xylariales sp. PMI_506]
MSSITGISRTRSLRKPPAATDGQSAPKEPSSAKQAAGTTSPSRLPQAKPLVRSSTTTAPSTSSSTTTRTRAPSSTLSRTVSSASSGTTAGARQPSSTAAARPLGRTPSARQAPSSTNAGIARREPTTATTTVSSGARPTSSSGLPSSTATRSRAIGHSRAKSTITATTLTAATTLRPPVSGTSSSRPPVTSNSTITAAAAGTRTRTRSQTAAHVRSLSHPTHQQSAGNTAVPAQAAAPPPSTTATSTAGSTTSTQRPTFNTNQQHYSPLKSFAPKPLTSTFLAPPSPSKLPANVALSAETSRLQTELLQLSLLHRDARAVTAEWHASAKGKLGSRFASLARESEAVCRAERNGVEGRNAAALVRWANGGSDACDLNEDNDNGSGIGNEVLDEKIQILDQILNGVWGFTDPEGRYSRVVRRFEAWLDRAAAILAAQRDGAVDDLLGRDDDNDDSTVLFLSDLDASWKAEVPGLARKLDGWERLLREIGPAPEGEDSGGGGDARGPRSSLARVLGGCGAAVCGMLTELATMERMERDAREAEDAWIERMNEKLRFGDDTQDNEVPLWKMAV